MAAEKSALTLLVFGVGADHHDPSVATNHPALLTHPFDRGTHLHGSRLSFFTNNDFITGVNVLFQQQADSIGDLVHRAVGLNGLKQPLGSVVGDQGCRLFLVHG